MKAARVKFNDFHVAYRVKSSFLARSGGIISEQIGKTGEDRISNIFSRPFPPLTSLETGCYSTCSYPIKMSKGSFSFWHFQFLLIRREFPPFKRNGHGRNAQTNVRVYNTMKICLYFTFYTRKWHKIKRHIVRIIHIKSWKGFKFRLFVRGKGCGFTIGRIG